MSLSSHSEPDGIWSEWDRLRSLRQHQDRIVLDRPYYQPPEDEDLDLKHKNATKYDAVDRYENALEAFDNGFRQILQRKDLDTFFNGELDKEALNEAQPHLSVLCKQLDEIVNTETLDSSSSGQTSSAIHSGKYHNLDCLIKTLDNSKWKFGVVTGLARKIFKIRSITVVEKTRDIVGSFNAYFNKLTSPTPREAQLLIDHRLLKDAGDDPAAALRGLTTLLSKLLKLPKCPRGHEILLQLTDWYVNTPQQNKSAISVTNLDLLISMCHLSDKTRWQECYLYPSLQSDQKGRDIEKLCGEIRDATSGISAVYLATHGENVFITDPEDYGKTQTSPQNKLTLKTLKELLQGHNFVSPSCQLYNFRHFQFSNKDKQLLAVRLVCSLILSLDSGQVLKCWDPEAVYFPWNSNGEWRPALLYASSVLKEKIRTTIQVPSNPNLSDAELEDIVFPRLAKLLFEIKFGYTREDIHIDDNHRDSRVSTLPDAINEAIKKDFSSKSFLEAVNICLTFRQRYVQIKRALRRKYRDDFIPTSAVRQLICVEIIRLIEGLDQHRDPKEDLAHNDGDVAPTSSIHDQLELSSGQTVELLPELRSDSYSSTRKKRVKFSEDSARKTEPDAIVGSLHDIEGNQGNAKVSTQFFQSMEQFQHACNEYYVLNIETDNLHLEERDSTMIPGSKIRIAVLDTGVDMSHWRVSDAFSDGRMSNERCYNWTRDANGAQYTDNIHDSNGHGTRVADLLMRIAPDAEICIAKVFESSDVKGKEAEYLAKAIKHAADSDKWNADIIVMSFSLNTIPGDDSEDELSRCRAEITQEIEARQDKIFIAAAGNDGRNKPRSFPASVMSSNVICMHASYGDGSEGAISPYPVETDDNFMTLGMDIEFDVPANAVAQNRVELARTTCKSGTSWATPIAAGIAANILHLVDAMDFKQTTRNNLRKGCVMKRMFREMSEGRANGYIYIAPWVKLWPVGWQKSEALIRNIEARVRAAVHG
ncbi:hypothetical protein F5Y10DRAFT_249672 [Nemania abortiva]|nr:hypothetical protein F5Y10DRAFT_249672 [Nemania abortiva]